MNFYYDSFINKAKKVYKKILVLGEELVKRQWVKYLVVIILIIMIGLGFSLGKINANRSYVISKLNMALNHGDVKTLAKIIRVNNESKKLTKEDLIPMMEYYRVDNSRIINLINNLKSGKEVNSLNIKSKRHWYGEEYYVVLTLKNIEIKSNFPGSKVYLNNKFVGEINDDGILKVEGIVPGDYNVKVENQNNYDKLLKEDKISFMDNSVFQEDLEGIKVSVNSEFTNGEVYINGESTKILVKDFKNIGPFSKESNYKIKIKQDTPWGEMFSEEKSIDGVPQINITIDLKNEKLTKDVEEQVSAFYKSLFEALNKEDKELIQETNSLVKDKLYNEMKKEYYFIKNNYNISDLEINMGNSEIKYNNDKFTGTIVVNISYNVSKKMVFFDVLKEKQEKSFFTRISYVNGKWVVDEVDKFK